MTGKARVDFQAKVSLLSPEQEAFQLLFRSRSHVVMSVLLPHFSSLPKLVRQMTKEEVQIFVGLRKCLLENREQVLDLWLGFRVCHLFRKQTQVLPHMCHILFRIQLPPSFEMSRDDLCGADSIDNVKSLLPRLEDLGSLDLFNPGSKSDIQRVE